MSMAEWQVREGDRAVAESTRLAAARRVTSRSAVRQQNGKGRIAGFCDFCVFVGGVN
jgi:hypothetical protein